MTLGNLWRYWWQSLRKMAGVAFASASGEFPV